MSSPLADRTREAHRLQRLGDLPRARALYEAILEQAPDHPPACNGLALIRLAEARPAEALILIDRALAARPGSAIYHNNRGNALRALVRPADARLAYEQALRIDPRYTRAHYNLGLLELDQGRARAALAVFDAILEREPAFAPASLSKARLLMRAGRDAQAEACLRRAIAAAPPSALAADALVPTAAVAALESAEAAETAELWIELGACLRLGGRIADAIPCLERAIALLPGRSASYNDLGALYQLVGRIDPALACFERALTLDPRSGHAWFNQGKLLADLNRFEEAARALERCLALEPTLATESACHLAVVRRHLCDWRDEARDTADLIARIEALLADETPRGLPPLTLNVVEIPAALRLGVARHLGRGVERETLAARGQAPFRHPVRPSSSPRPEPARLRVGYVSPDFRQHAVGSLIHDLFRHHDRAQVEVFAYSLVPVDDDFSRSIRSGVDHFIDVSRQTPAQSAQRIHADGIDVLVDLAGYTTHSKTGIFALRPAPLQLHWLGYLDTMGADYLPYMIADEIVIPDEALPGYSETIVTLPRGFAVASPLPIDATPTRGSLGLPDDAFVFCCMNGLHKLDAEVFDAWMRILTRVPNGLLWLADEGSAAARARLAQEARARGIDASRLVFAPRAALPAYLARYRIADLFLDTFAYNAGATAAGALQAGLPVLTRPGTRFMSRMGASLCRSAGLDDLVCSTTDAYVERAVALSEDPGALATLRARLGTGAATAPLFDLRGFAAQLESAYHATWRHRAERSVERRVHVPA